MVAPCRPPVRSNIAKIGARDSWPYEASNLTTIELVLEIADEPIATDRIAGEPVRVSGLGTFTVASRPARQGRNPQSGETIKIAASKGVRFHAGKAANLTSPIRALRGT
jgi:DNA-binding protein HU-beta